MFTKGTVADEIMQSASVEETDPSDSSEVGSDPGTSLIKGLVDGASKNIVDAITPVAETGAGISAGIALLGRAGLGSAQEHGI